MKAEDLTLFTYEYNSDEIPATHLIVISSFCSATRAHVMSISFINRNCTTLLL
jgi:hypothetical protein